VLPITPFPNGVSEDSHSKTKDLSLELHHAAGDGTEQPDREPRAALRELQLPD
jgi:hypothetical protein